jgi:hypothetical protein
MTHRFTTQNPPRQRQHGWRRQPRRTPGGAPLLRPRAFGTFGKQQPKESSDSSEPEEPLPEHFDLDTSILLAGFAFESYLSPEGGLLDTDVRGRGRCTRLPIA